MSAHRSINIDTPELRQWAQEVTTAVMVSFDPRERVKLDFEFSVQLAMMLYYADNLLPAELGSTGGPALDLIHEAFRREFGAYLEFMARVREVWYKERNAKDVTEKKYRIESGTRGATQIADSDGKIPATPEFILHVMRRADYRAWAERFEKDRGKPPLAGEIAEMLERDFNMRVSVNQIYSANKKR